MLVSNWLWVEIVWIDLDSLKNNWLQKTGEVNSPKLTTLQNILQSEFFGAVREVYETVYDTIDVDGPPEVIFNYNHKFVKLV